MWCIAGDIIDLLGSEPAARKVIRNLLRKGWLTRLVGGRYMLLPPERGPENLGENNPIALASAVVDPSYVGWWSAAAFHGFTTQKPMTVTVAVLRQSPMRTIEGTEVRFIKIATRKFSGFKSYPVYRPQRRDLRSGEDRVDCIDRPDLAGGVSELARIVYNAMGEVDPDKLFASALAMKSTALLQRLGFLSDLVGRPMPTGLRLKVRDAIPHPGARSSDKKNEKRRMSATSPRGAFLFMRAAAIFCRKCQSSRRKVRRSC